LLLVKLQNDYFSMVEFPYGNGTFLNIGKGGMQK